MSRFRVAIVVFLVGALFVASMLTATGGRPSLPLDDSFIYFQYARQAAAGHPLVYQDGDPPTTGATSVPWMLCLTAGSLLGFGGKAMIFFSLILGGVLLAVTARFAGETARDLSPADLAVGGVPLATALVLVSGPLQWAAWSGMEIALFAGAIAWAFREWVRAGGVPTARAAGALALLAVVRPEGAMLAVAAGAWWGVRGLLDAEARRGLGWAALPALAVLVQPMINLVATGEARSAGFIAKTLFAVPGYGPLDVVRIALLRAASLSGALFAGIAPLADGKGLYAYDSETAPLFVAPGAAILFGLGVLPALADEWRARRPGAGTLAVTWVASILVATCTLEEPDAHFGRYQMPILPVFLVFVAVGVGRLARATAAAAGGLAWLAPGVQGWLLLFGAGSLVFFLAAYGDNCEDIDRMQIAFGESLRESLEPEAVVAINDAGALTYFSGRRTLDLVGLTSPGLAGLWAAGPGCLFETLESLPPGRRPLWFCFFPNWFEFDGLGVLRPTGSVRLLTPSIVDAEKVLAFADWSLARSGDASRLGGNAGARTVDRIDVADVASEREHGFRFHDGQPGYGGTFVRRASFADRPEDEAIDGGRTVLGSVEFQIGRDILEPTGLVVRTVTGVRQRVLVSLDGGPEREVELYAPNSGRFHEQLVTGIPPGPSPAHVRMRVRPGPAASAPLVITHVYSIAGVH